MYFLDVPSQENLILQLKAMAKSLGFSDLAVSSVDLSHAEAGLLAWLEAGFHGQMHYMAEHGLKRARPAELLPDTVSVLTLRMDYLPRSADQNWIQQDHQRLEDASQAIISRYARGRDYHKVLRSRLQKMVVQMQELLGPFQARVFTDSAPVLEVEMASTAGLGWRGKNTLLLHPQAGSMFFLGEIFLNIPLQSTPASQSHCGSCSRCMDLCPTGAIVEPYRVDARRCISYLTIEYDGAIPIDLRPAIGNRIYGCDDCQLVCPWNKFAQTSVLTDFDERHDLGKVQLIDLLKWDETQFLNRTEGSPIRRIGFQRWSRNLVVAAGNALATVSLAREQKNALIEELTKRLPHANELLKEHIDWALSRVMAS